MARYIDADKINYSVYSLFDGQDLEGNTLYLHRAIAFESDIDEMPTADVVEVRHGYVIEHKGHEDEYYCECSVCKTHEISLDDNYCPNCGAKMDGTKVR